MPLMDGKAKEEGITAKDVDPKQLAKGMKVEGEHTKAPWLAKAIALDHIAEIPNYYDRLEKMEGEAKKAYDQGYALAMIKRAGIRDWVREHPHASAYMDPLGLIYPSLMAPEGEQLKTQLHAAAGQAIGGIPGGLLGGAALNPIAEELFRTDKATGQLLPEVGTRLRNMIKGMPTGLKVRGLGGLLLGIAGVAEGSYQATAPHSTLNDWRASKKGIVDRIRHHFA